MCYTRNKEDLISVKVRFTKCFLFCISFIKKVNLRKMTFNLILAYHLFNSFCLKVAISIKECDSKEYFRVIAFT